MYTEPPMSPKAARLLREALALSERDRAALATDLLASVRASARTADDDDLTEVVLSQAEQSALLREWADRGPQGPIEEEDDAW
jgi:hypothetical protein